MRIVQSGNDFRKVGKIFITHPHSDHDDGLATLLNSEWEFQRAEPIDIYGGGVEALVKGAIAYLQPNADIRWSEGKKRPMADTFHGHDVSPGVIYQDANVKVTAVENTHFHFQPGDPAYGKYHSYSYRFETPDKKSGVLHRRHRAVRRRGRSSRKAPTFTSPRRRRRTMGGRALQAKAAPGSRKRRMSRRVSCATMHEEHVTPEDIGKMAAKAGVKSVVMSHLGPSFDPNDDYHRYVDEAKKYDPGPITIAKDLMKF